MTGCVDENRMRSETLWVHVAAGGQEDTADGQWSA